MKGTRVAYRYAKSLLNLAIEQNMLDEVFKDMETVSTTCKENRELMLLLKSPIIKTDKKQAILKEVFEGLLGKTSMNFINILTSKKREYLLAQVAADYLRQHKAHKKITTIVLTSAVPLDKKAKDAILASSDIAANGEVEIIERIDKDIIGGYIIRIGDEQIDASVAYKLSSLKRNFSENPYIPEF